MYWFWYFLFAVFPILILFAMMGLLGKEAEEAADDFARAMGIILLVIVALAAIGGLIYLILKGVGII
jgi:hypothetical protein